VPFSIRLASPRGRPRELGNARVATFRVRRVVSPPLGSIHGASNGASRTQVDLLAKLSRHKGGKCGYAWGCFLSVHRRLGNLIYQPIFHGDRREEFPAATLEMRASSHRKGAVLPIFFAEDRRFGIPQRLTNGSFKVFFGLVVYKHRHGSILSVAVRLVFNQALRGWTKRRAASWAGSRYRVIPSRLSRRHSRAATSQTFRSIRRRISAVRSGAGASISRVLRFILSSVVFVSMN